MITGIKVADGVSDFLRCARLFAQRFTVLILCREPAETKHLSFMVFGACLEEQVLSSLAVVAAMSLSQPRSRCEIGGF